MDVRADAALLERRAHAFASRLVGRYEDSEMGDEARIVAPHQAPAGRYSFTVAPPDRTSTAVALINDGEFAL